MEYLEFINDKDKELFLNLKSICKSKIELYCMDKNIENIYDINPMQWLSILKSISENVFNNNILYTRDKTDRIYKVPFNHYKLMIIYDIYTDICMEYIQEISPTDYCIFAGIDLEIYYDLTTKYSNFCKKQSALSQASLEKLMFDRRNNPVKYIAKLNKYYGYSQPVQVQEQKISISIAEKLPKLSITDGKTEPLPLPEVNENE